MAKTILDTCKFNSEKSFNGKPLEPDEVLVPIWLKKSLQLDNDSCIHENFTTWHIGGYRFLIGFAPIKEAAFAEYMKFFNKEINAYLEQNRAGRCIIGRKEDGTPIICSKTNTCKGCPSRGLLERYNPKRDEVEILSLDFQYENEDFDVEDKLQPSVEDQVFAASEPTEDELFDSLIAYLNSKKKRYAQIVLLKKQKLSEEEIIDKIGLKRSRGYQEINNAYHECLEFFHIGYREKK